MVRLKVVIRVPEAMAGPKMESKGINNKVAQGFARIVFLLVVHSVDSKTAPSGDKSGCFLSEPEKMRLSRKNGHRRALEKHNHGTI